MRNDAALRSEESKFVAPYTIHRLQLHRFARNDREQNGECPHNLLRAHGTDESIGISSLISSLISGTKMMLALTIDVLNGKVD